MLLRDKGWTREKKPKKTSGNDGTTVWVLSNKINLLFIKLISHFFSAIMIYFILLCSVMHIKYTRKILF